MRKLTVPLAAAAAAVMMTLAVTSVTSRAADSYADDRSAIEDLQARYLFALDFHDPDLYVSTFTVLAQPVGRRRMLRCSDRVGFAE